jgi:PAS domain S-box-containing protein
MSVVRVGSDEAATFQLAIEASPSGILVVDAGGRIVLINAEVERQFGYARHEIVGQAVEVLLPEALQSIQEAHRRAFADPATPPAARPMSAGRELYGRRKDGSPLAIEMALKPLEGAEGPLVLASIVDVTERQRTRNSQRASFEEQLEFERFVVELSVRFINLPNEQIAAAIAELLPGVCAQLGLDRCSFFKLAIDSVMVDHVTWTAPDLAPVEEPLSAKTLYPWTIERLLAGGEVSFSTLSEVTSAVDRESFRRLGLKSGVLIPLSVDGRVEGGVAFAALRAERTWTPEVVHRLKVFASVFDRVLARQKRDETLHGALQEVQRLKDQVQAENVDLRREVRERLGLTAVVGRSPAVRQVLEQIQQVASTDSTVLLLGETGTGKELFAAQIHELGTRHARAMVRVNCAAIPARKAPTRERWRGRWAGSSWPTTRRSSSTRLAICRPRCRSSCCACSKSVRSSGSGARGR